METNRVEGEKGDAMAEIVLRIQRSVYSLYLITVKKSHTYYSIENNVNTLTTRSPYVHRMTGHSRKTPGTHRRTGPSHNQLAACVTTASHPSNVYSLYERVL